MNAKYYNENRNKLAQRLQHGLIVLYAYQELQSVGDMTHKFTQEPNFWYLSGVNEPGWRLVIDGLTNKSWLIAPTIDDVHAVFDGILSSEQARELSGVETIISADELEPLLRQLARKHKLVYTIDQPSWIDRANFVPNPALSENRKMLERIFPSVRSCNAELAKLRAIKQPTEIAAIQKAIDVTCKSFAEVRNNITSYTHEYEIEADFTYDFIRCGSEGHAYEPIVASGKNACTLHYNKNRDKLRTKNLVLLDVGAKIDGYAADITRTYARGEPTKRQAAVHAAVQNAQSRIISLLGPSVSVERYHHDVDVIMIDTLRELDLVGADAQASLRKYMPHSIGHGLGLDVHDSLGAPRYFEPGMVLTVEPGIYIPEEGIGVRIEDDILITEKGYKNLSAKLSTDW